MEEVDEIAHRPNSIPISCSMRLNMDGLLERIWDMMALVRHAALGGDCCGVVDVMVVVVVTVHGHSMFVQCSDV
jgi:hypothetical protein